MKKGYICIAVTTILFSLMEIVLKTISGDFNPIQMTFTRFLIGGLVLLPVALKTMKKRGLKFDKSMFATFTKLGFIGICISMVFYQLAVGAVKASVVAVLFSCNPIFVMLFAAVFLRETISKNNIAALVLEVVGAVIIINPFNIQISITGIIYTIIATLTFALYGVMGKKHTKKYSGEVVACFGFLFGAAELMLISSVTHIDAAADFFVSKGLDTFANIPFIQGYNWSNLLAVAFVCIAVTGIGFASYFKAMELTSAAKASLVFFFKQALAPLLAFLILGEELPFNMLMGIAIILIGSVASIVPGILGRRTEQLAAEARKLEIITLNKQ